VHRAAGPSAPAFINLRPAAESDLPRMVEIGNAVFPDFAETIEEAADHEARLRAEGCASVHVLAELPDGQAVGLGRFRHQPGQYDPLRYHVAVFVLRAMRGRGIGGALFAWVLDALRARGARALESFARETMPEAVAFLERRGFRDTMRTWETVLDVAAFDPAPFAFYQSRATDAGVMITTLAEECARDAGALRRAYDLHNAVVADIPFPAPFTPPSFDYFVRSNVESPRALPEAYFIARIGDTYVGEANLHRPATGIALHHSVTGVLPAYRDRGIAMALKLATIAYAQAHGYAQIRTWNETGNAGMLAINDRLGFVRQPAWITLERTLAPEGGS
jgi:mycothiol synthase